jgi:nitrous oxidase accessory protein
MRTILFATCLHLIVLSSAIVQAGEVIKNTEALIAAVRDREEGAVLDLEAGQYELRGTLELKSGMTLRGAGIGKTVITNHRDWKPSSRALPEPEMRLEGLDVDAYLIRIKRDTSDVTISGMTLHGPQVHGAIFSWFHQGLHLHHLQIKETQWCGLRTFGMQKAKIHDCEFIDAGGRWEHGEPGVKGGNTGGGIFACWMGDCEIFNNRFRRTRQGPAEEFYGIKVRQGTRCRVHHNTIETNFSMEFPFENDEDNELDHNVCSGTISIPKYAGGAVPKSGSTFHIHDNWFKDSYSIEFVRNGVEIDHNLFDFDVKADHGNLIAAFGDAAAPGPASFHHNMVSNPGRGVIWINEVFNNLQIRNNHIITRTTSTPREEGLFGFNPATDFKTITIEGNRIECIGQPRPLLRCPESYSAVIRNNSLTNVSDTKKYENTSTGKPIGLEHPLQFRCGAHEEFAVNGWESRRAVDPVLVIPPPVGKQAD